MDERFEQISRVGTDEEGANPFWRYCQSNGAALFQVGYRVSTRVDRHASFFIRSAFVSAESSRSHGPRMPPAGKRTNCWLI